MPLICDDIFTMLNRSLPLLLPAIEDGIFSDNWRIRQSSVELLGDLLFKVSYLLYVALSLWFSPFQWLHHLVMLFLIGGWNFWEGNP